MINTTNLSFICFSLCNVCYYIYNNGVQYLLFLHALSLCLIIIIIILFNHKAVTRNNKSYNKHWSSFFNPKVEFLKVFIFYLINSYFVTFLLNLHIKLSFRLNIIYIFFSQFYKKTLLQQIHKYRDHLKIISYK
jgi:preprotein translocase subunit SecG